MPERALRSFYLSCGRVPTRIGGAETCGRLTRTPALIETEKGAAVGKGRLVNELMNAARQVGMIGGGGERKAPLVVRPQAIGGWFAPNGNGCTRTGVGAFSSWKPESGAWKERRKISMGVEAISIIRITAEDVRSPQDYKSILVNRMFAGMTNGHHPPSRACCLGRKL